MHDGIGVFDRVREGLGAANVCIAAIEATHLEAVMAATIALPT